jgi:hypothetical protein
MAAMPANSTTVTNYYNQSVYDPSGTKIGGVGDRDALVPSGKASFAEEVVRAKNSDNCLLTLVRHDGKLYLALLDVEDRIRRVSL